LNDTLAEITVDLESRRVINVTLRERQLAFNCRRCAVFCCKLGAPRLTPKDIQRLERAGFHLTEILCMDQSTLRKGHDDACILLSWDQKHRLYKCACYDTRPALCRLYPFRFERLGHNLFALKLIPCCNGLNERNGESVNEEFVARFAGPVLFELIDARWLRPHCSGMDRNFEMPIGSM
jgi:Fe-S-cluster containining protein